MNEIGKLYRLQDKILASLSDFVTAGNRFPFFLTGGTALVRFHFKSAYRVSYDLDFFSTEDVTEEDVKRVVSTLHFEWEYVSERQAFVQTGRRN